MPLREALETQAQAELQRVMTEARLHQIRPIADTVAYRSTPSPAASYSGPAGPTATRTTNLSHDEENESEADSLFCN